MNTISKLALHVTVVVSNILVMLPLKTTQAQMHALVAINWKAITIPPQNMLCID